MIHPSNPNGAAVAQGKKRMSGALTEVLLASTILVLPMLTLSALLLALIFHNQVHDISPLFDDGIHPTTILDRDAYYVDYSATRLITVASWTSTVAPWLPVFVMTLLSYPIAQRILDSSRVRSTLNLPTPYQTSLLLELYSGSVGSIWPLLRYKLWTSHERLPGVARAAVTGLIAAWTIGFGILASDTWLHTATSTVLVDQFAALIDNSLNPGRALNTTYCSSSNRLQSSAPCSLNVAATSVNLVGSDEAFKTFANRSSINQISPFQDNTTTYTYLGAAGVSSNTDYRASTFAVGTTCLPISEKCNLRAAYGASTPFDCTPAYQGDLTLLNTNDTLVSPYPVNLTFFQDAAFTNGMGYSYSRFQNPIRFGSTTLLSSAGVTPGRGASSNIAEDPEMVTPVHGGLAWILNCTTTIYDLQYTWANGSLTHYTITPSNDSMAAVFGAAISGSWVGSYLTGAAVIASFQETADDLAYDFATQVSQITAAMGAGLMIPEPSDQAQTRIPTLVARIPKAPLFTLVLLNLIYALGGLVLALYVIFFSRYAESRDPQSRLSIAGLAATCFEPVQRSQADVTEVEELFTEKIRGKGFSQRIGIEQVPEGGWRFALF